MTYTFVTTADQDSALALAAPEQGLADAGSMFQFVVASALASLVSQTKQQILMQLEPLPVATLQTIYADAT